MDLYAHGGPNRSLQAEVDMYFNNISSVSYPNIMTFWQVSETGLLLSAFTYSF